MNFHDFLLLILFYCVPDSFKQLSSPHTLHGSELQLHTLIERAEPATSNPRFAFDIIILQWPQNNTGVLPRNFTLQVHHAIYLK
jgi:hypothetical protein